MIKKRLKALESMSAPKWFLKVIVPRDIVQISCYLKRKSQVWFENIIDGIKNHCFKPEKVITSQVISINRKGMEMSMLPHRKKEIIISVKHFKILFANIFQIHSSETKFLKYINVLVSERSMFKNHKTFLIVLMDFFLFVSFD